MYDAEHVRCGAILHPPSLIVHDVACVEHVHIYGTTCISSITDGQYSMCRACVCVCVCVATLYPTTFGVNPSLPYFYRYLLSLRGAYTCIPLCMSFTGDFVARCTVCS